MMANKIMIFWCVVCLGATYQMRDAWRDIEDGDVLAWSVHITGQDTADMNNFDTFKSVAAIPGNSNKANGDTRYDDEVWVVVNRTIDGNDYTFIEQFQSLDWGDDADYCWFVDAAMVGFSGGGGGLTLYTPTTTTGVYPTLQALTGGEIPSTPSEPAEIALSNPISVTNAAGLQAMTPGNHYSIDNDIDLQGVVWTPLVFNSANAIVIEGNNNTISNLSISAKDGQYKGFIEEIDGTGGGQIRNITFSNCSVIAGNTSGIFCGLINSDAENLLIKNINFNTCTITQDDTAFDGTEFGMLAGEIVGKATYITDCNATDCIITSETDDIGLIGIMIGNAYELDETTNSTINECTVVNGTINANGRRNTNIGGFVGQLSGSATGTRDIKCFDCTCECDIVITPPAGQASAYVIIGIGGFAGTIDSAATTTCTATGSIAITLPGDFDTSDTVSSIAGFFGNSSCFETHTNNSTTVTIDITGNGDNILLGAIAGFGGSLEEDVTILRCYSQGDITFNVDIGRINDIGGFLGNIKGTGVSSSITRSWTESDITFNNDVTKSTGRGNIGGFIGRIYSLDNLFEGDVQNCYAWGSILMNSTYSNTLTVAGFIAEWENISDMVIQNCYCAQTDTAAGSGYTNQLVSDLAKSYSFGGDASKSNITETALFYDTNTCGFDSSILGTGHITSWMQTKANYQAAGWDFTTIWVLEEISTPGAEEPNKWDGWYDDLPMEVCVYADGIPLGTYTIDANGVLDLGAAYSVVIAGINYYSIYESFPINLSYGAGWTSGFYSAIRNVKIDFYESMGCHVGVDIDNSVDWTFSYDDFATSIEPVTEIKLAPFVWGRSREPVIYLWEWDPIPMTVRNIRPKMEVFME